MTVEFRPRRSRVALVLLWASVVAALAALACSALPVLPAAMAGAGAIVVGTRQSRCATMLPLLGYDGAGWYLDDGAVRSHGRLGWQRSLLPGFLALRFVTADGRQRRSLVLFADALERDQWRRLRMLLQCCGD